MNEVIFKIILGAAKLLMDPKTKQNATNLREAVKLLIEELKPDLPVKADGTPWNQTDIDALADKVVALNEEVKDRMRT